MANRVAALEVGAYSSIRRKPDRREHDQDHHRDEVNGSSQSMMVDEWDDKFQLRTWSFGPVVCDRSK
jgi:hypothetical protein